MMPTGIELPELIGAIDPAPYTWADQLKPFILRELKPEGIVSADADEEAYWLIFANQLLAEVSRETRCYRRTYNATDWAETYSGGWLPLPASLIEIIGEEYGGIYWDGLPLRRATRALVDGWTITTTPATEPDVVVIEGQSLCLYPRPADVSLLTVEAYAVLPPLPADIEGEANPMGFIPREYQLLPARFVCAMLPFDPEHSAAATRQARNAAEVQRLMPNLIDALMTRSLPTGSGL